MPGLTIGSALRRCRTGRASSSAVMPRSTSGSPSVAMSQSKIDFTRSGSAGVELAVVELVVVVEDRRARRDAASSRASRSPTAGHQRLGAVGRRPAPSACAQPADLALDEALGPARGRRGRPPRARRGAGRRGRRRRRGRRGARRRRGARIDGGTAPQITSPDRYSMTRKSEPITLWSSQNRKARGARSKPRHSRDSVRYSRRMSWAPGAMLPERRAAHDEAPIAEARRGR